MGHQLLQTSPVFAERVTECARAFEPMVRWSLIDVLDGTAEPSLLERVDVVQPALFAVMVSLAELWRSVGVRPDAVVGHSQGEIAAAYVAGAISLQDAARIVILRSQALTQLAGRGGMASVSLPAKSVQGLLTGYEGLGLAAANGPTTTVVSGDIEQLGALLHQCERDGIHARRIAVDYASHSPQVETLEEQLLEAFGGIQARSVPIAFCSTVTGQMLDTAELDNTYWFRNLRQPVRFDQALDLLLDQGYTTFVEASTHPLLTIGIEQACDTAGIDRAVVVGSLRRDEGGLDRLLHSAAVLYAAGARIEWPTVFTSGRQQQRALAIVALPTYAFDRRHYWLTAGPGSGDLSALGLERASHPLMGAVVESPDTGAVIITGRVSSSSEPWLADHAVTGVVILAGTGFLELVLQAGHQVACPLVRELTLITPLVVPVQGGVQIRVVVAGPDRSSDDVADGERAVTVFSRTDTETGAWILHAQGVLSPVLPAPETGELAGAWPPAGAVAVEIDDAYDQLTAMGLEYGPQFRGLQGLWRRGQELFVEAQLPDPDVAARFGMHPALLDAVLQAIPLADGPTTEHGVGLPFAWQQVSLHTTGAPRLRAQIARGPGGEVALTAVNALGEPVLSAGSLVMRPIEPGQLASISVTGSDPLHLVHWIPVPDTGALAEVAAAWFTDAEDLITWLESGYDTAEIDPPTAVVLDLHRSHPGESDLLAGTHALTHAVLRLLQAWSSTPWRSTAATLVVTTRGAVTVAGDDEITDLPATAVWGLVRTAQTEDPGRLVILDTDTGLDAAALTRVLASHEPQTALRDDVLHAARLAPVREQQLLEIPSSRHWRLEVTAKGTLDGLTLKKDPRPHESLSSGQIRVAVKAGGLNFRDVLICLGMYPDADAVIGSEIAGVVLEVAPDVTTLTPGDRVMGLADGGLGPTATTDHRLVVRIPERWSFADAAAVPIAFLTAYYALEDLGKLQQGEKLVIHAATGGVGMAAVQLARHWGAEVFATASQGKWDTLRGMGFDEAHIGDSRSLAFGKKFSAATGDAGVDVVLNSLAGDFVDTSLDLLASGGRFVEMGKTDIRDRDSLATEYPDVRYRAFDLLEAGAERIQEMFAHLVELFEAEVLHRLPARTWDIRRAPDALRFFSQARQIGKIVLTLSEGPVSGQPITGIGGGTVLITGGTGVLGAALARHLVAVHRVPSLVLVSRRGMAAVGAVELIAELTELGAHIEVVACDVSDRAALAVALAAVPDRFPLTGVVHAAGVLDDGTVEALTPARIDTVLEVKADSAWHLHELTRERDLALFVLYSSIAGVLGGAGQGNYAAANVFLDGLAEYRRARGLAATSIAWGWWAPETGMTGHLTRTDTTRMNRGGLAAMTVERGLALFDAAVVQERATVVAAQLDVAALGEQARAGTLMPLLQALAPRTRRAGRNTGNELRLHHRIAGLPESEQLQLISQAVRAHVAATLGYLEPEAIDAGRNFRDLGFDSLSAVEARNRLNKDTGLKLPATLVFDHPTPEAVARHIHHELAAIEETPSHGGISLSLNVIEKELRRHLRDNLKTAETRALLGRLIALEERNPLQENREEVRTALQTATEDELLSFIENQLKN
ncbi:SDR family NAD(P)-dependent oxidoreductase [Nocardia sp. NPDC004604]|uniref:SDR family NAD(P)-dependent oxidoreductase n=1 Tax=Nocardia sp. NPDC004604 TaxID=3157013 RepID=UPI0033B908D7